MHTGDKSAQPRIRGCAAAGDCGLRAAKLAIAERGGTGGDWLGRRQWVRVFALGSAQVLAGGGGSSALLAEIGPGANPAGVITLPFAQFPVLQQVFGSIRFRLFNAVPQGTMIVTRAPENIFYAVSAFCTHQQNLVNPFEAGDTNRMICYEHNSEYDIQGRIMFPAEFGQANLPRYNTRTMPDAVQIEVPGLNLKVTNLRVESAAASSKRLALSFPTNQGATYRVRFSETLNGPGAIHPFFTTAEGVTSVTQVLQSSANPNPRVVYVDADTARPRGFYAVEMVVEEVPVL
jgi:nitrite reductase/ring-hydroxylating ferredoxin subunit